MGYVLIVLLLFWFLWLWQKNRENLVRFPFLETLLTIGSVLALIAIGLINRLNN